MKKVKTEYVAIVNGDKYVIFSPDISRINPHTVLGCVLYEGSAHSSLYYNEGNYSKEELESAGYGIVDEIVKVDTYTEETTIYK